MNYLIDIFKYFTGDPLRILSLIGGTGGLVYWYDRYKNRSRLRVMLLDLGLMPRAGKQQAYIRFEAENFGTIPISIEPYVLLKGFIPLAVQKKSGHKLKRSSYVYEIDSNERNLPPHVPKIFEAFDNVGEMRPFLWFMTYTFTPTRGKAQKLRIRSAENFQLSYARYIYELLSYALFNKLTLKE